MKNCIKILILLNCFVNLHSQTLLFNKVKIKEEVLFGADTSNYESQLGYVTFIQTNSNQDVYILDKTAQKIKVYKKDGSYLKSIGRRGSGPGEFSQINKFFIIDDELIVFDYYTEKISFFDKKGKFLKSKKFNNLIAPNNMLKVNNNYLLNFRKRGYSEKEILHFYDLEFQKKTGAISSDLFYYCNNNKYEQYYKSKNIDMEYYGDEQNIIFNKGYLYFAKFIYNGVIYRLINTNGKWKVDEKLYGFRLTPKDYYIDYNDDGKKLGSDIIPSNNKLSIYVPSRSEGLYKYNDNKLIHFTVQHNYKERMLIAELFGPNGKLINAYVIDKLPITESFRYQILCKDSNDYFYIFDHIKGIAKKIKFIFED